MAGTVHCVKLGREAEGLDQAPYPGELGQRILENVSKEAWQMWLQHQTMLMNEMRLTPIDPKARQFLEQEMEKFFFGEGSERPEGYVPPESLNPRRSRRGFTKC
ncbi:MAG: oxidative damage protection protein [Halofilum sp. (in: g-proteobacteria)]|nr:oxidative damage protection protein [Halofilum sp. (in: g-proteobacteria)]